MLAEDAVGQEIAVLREAYFRGGSAWVTEGRERRHSLRRRLRRSRACSFSDQGKTRSYHCALE